MLGLGERVVSGVELLCSRAGIFLRPLNKGTDEAIE